MKSVNYIMPKEIMNQLSRNLKSLSWRMKRKFFENIKTVAALQISIKAVMMIIFFLLTNGVFASNYGIVLRRNADVITNGESEISYSKEPHTTGATDIPGTFWFGRFDVLGKMVQVEEMTECSATTSGTDGHSTIDDGTEKSSFREGRSIAIATARPVECVFNTMPEALFHRARLGDEEMYHFYTQKPAKIKRIGYAYKVPFTLRHNLILIEATVGGKKGLLLLDTGTDQLILNQKHFRGKPGTSYISGVHDDMNYSQRKYVKLQISNLPVHSQNAFITDLSHLEEPLQFDILGICGVDFLQKFQWEIHYHQSFIEFFTLDRSGNLLERQTHSPAGDTLPLQKEAGLLTVRAQIDGLTMYLALDTGASSTVLDKKSKSAFLTQTGNFEKLLHVSNAVGISGSREMTTSFALSDLKVGNTNIPPIQVSFLSLSKVNRGRYLKLDGIFNPLFMCHRTIAINWKKKQMYIWEDAPRPKKTNTKAENWLANLDQTNPFTAKQVTIIVPKINSTINMNIMIPLCIRYKYDEISRSMVF